MPTAHQAVLQEQSYQTEYSWLTKILSNPFLSWLVMSHPLTGISYENRWCKKRHPNFCFLADCPKQVPSFFHWKGTFAVFFFFFYWNTSRTVSCYSWWSSLIASHYDLVFPDFESASSYCTCAQGAVRSICVYPFLPPLTVWCLFVIVLLFLQGGISFYSFPSHWHS